MPAGDHLGGTVWGNSGGQLYIDPVTATWHCDHRDFEPPDIPEGWYGVDGAHWAGPDAAYWLASQWAQGAGEVRVGRSDFLPEQQDAVVWESDGATYRCQLAPMPADQGLGLTVQFTGHTGAGPVHHRKLWLPPCAVVLDPNGNGAEIVDV